MAWLHWVGSKYYTYKSFKKEAIKLGISRRITLNVLRQMKWGEKIYLVMKAPDLGKKPRIVGYFYLNRIELIGSDKTLAELLDEAGISYHVVSENDLMKEEIRGCGRRVIGGVYLCTKAMIPEIVDAVQFAKTTIDEKGRLKANPEVNIGADIDKVVFFQKTVPIKIKPFRGYQQFNEEQFLKDLAEGKSTYRAYYKAKEV
jgi:ASC-1-like (ASCH) protein